MCAVTAAGAAYGMGTTAAGRVSDAVVGAARAAFGAGMEKRVAVHSVRMLLRAFASTVNGKNLSPNHCIRGADMIE